MVCFCSAVFGQTTSDTSSVGKTQDLDYTIKGFTAATYHYGKKISEDPMFRDTIKVDSEVEYSFVDKKLESDFEVDQINAPKLNMLEPLDKLYKTYVALGLSDFKTPPYFDFTHNTLRSREYNAGVSFNHISQEQKIGDIDNARYSNSSASFFGKKFYQQSTWYSSVDYDYQTLRFYGYNKDQLPVVDEDLLINEYSKLNAQTGLMSSVRGTGKIGYDVNVNYDQLLGKDLAVAEHLVDINSNVNWLMKTKPMDFIVDIDFGAAYLNSGRVLSDHSSTLFDLSVVLNRKSELYDLKFGVKGFFQTAQEREIWGFPFVEADYSFVKDVLHVYGRITTDFKRNSYLSYIDVNPFISNGEDVISTVTKQDFRGGLKGAFNSKSSFNVGISYKNIHNMPLYYNVGNSGYNKFQILKDRVEHRQAFAEFVWDSKKLDFHFKGEYNIYDVFKNEAFHLPALYSELGARYKLKQKIEVGANVFFYGEQLALDRFDSQDRPITKTLKPIVDFNFDLKYNYNQRLGAFLSLNNVLNTKHIRWDHYSNYGFNFLFGVGYSF